MAMALEGIRIIDMTIWQHGPVATCMLADMGAEVIKIETRTGGDPGRNFNTWLYRSSNDFPLNYYFENNNRNKKSLAIDLKKAEGKEIIKRLLKKSDVFVSNFREAALKRLELDYETAHKLNPRLVYAEGYGFGAKGPDASRPSADMAAQARGGIISQVLPSTPIHIWGGIADQSGALMLALGVAIALVTRERTGIGQKVEESLMGTQLALGALMAQGALFLNQPPSQYRREVVRPFWNVYKAKDGKWLCLSILETGRYWQQVCQLLGLEWLAEDPRFQAEGGPGPEHTVELINILDQAFAKKTRDEWAAILNETDINWAPVQDYAEALSDPQTIANDYVVELDHPNVGPVKMLGLPIKLSETPGKVRTPAPELGQHTEEVLTEVLGYSWDEVTTFREHQVI